MAKFQVGHIYQRRPHMLGNWEVADTHKQQPSNASSPTCKTEDGRTIPICDKNGHLLVKKRPAAFTKPPVYALSAPRWPQVRPASLESVGMMHISYCHISCPRTKPSSVLESGAGCKMCRALMRR